jgi:SAM-dependent methyltransferase
MSEENSRTAAARYCADTFNAAIAAAAVSAAWEMGLLDELERERSIDVVEFCGQRNSHRPTVQSILLALSSRSIVELSSDRSRASRGEQFDIVFQAKGFFYWLTRGCGELFSTLPSLVDDSVGRTGKIQRDSRAIGIACRDIARAFFDPPLWEIMQDVPFSRIADLGCGSGDRIATIVAANPGTRAIGIDIADGALAVAKEAIAEADLEDRITLVQDDVQHLTSRYEYDEVDLVTCFLMGHDFWPRDNAVRILTELKTVFPRAANLVLGDTCRSSGLTGAQYPMFSLGFETVHSVMDQYLPTLGEWDEIFSESGWYRADQRMIDLPAFSFIFRLTPALNGRPDSGPATS